jgi:hypothetical protein
MTGRSFPLAVLAAAFALGAAAAPPQGGTISVVTTSDRVSGVTEAVGEALGAHGFTLLRDAGHSASIAQVTFRRTTVGEAQARIAPGRAAITPGVFGGGGGVTLPLGGMKTRTVALTRSELELRIVRRTTQAVVWQGTAITVRPDTGDDTTGATAAALAEGVLRSYPYEPRGIVSVR